MKHTRILFLIALLVVAGGNLSGVKGATITVTSSAGLGPGSLHQALVDANDGDTINFSLPPSSYIQVYFDPLLVDKSVTISGPGAANLTVFGTGGRRVFDIAAGKNVTISGLTIMNGVDDAGGGIYNDHSALTLNNCEILNNFSGGVGGGIYNSGTLTINNCTISNNTSVTFLGSEGSGGGIYNDGRAGSAMLTVTNSTISNNDAEGHGGGIYNNGRSGSATLTITSSRLNDNSAGYDGGAICSAPGEGSQTLTIMNSTLTGNSAGSSGGGISIDVLGANANATLTINNSTLDGNSALNGGGISHTAGGYGFTTATITNSTLSGNSADPDYGSGGGIVNVGGQASATMTIANSTFNGNSAHFGGGIYNADNNGAATLTLGNTILKTGASGENIISIFGNVISNGYNVSNDDGGGFLTATNDRTNTDPMLGPLQDNGGPTFTHELLTGSPAIDTGDPNFAPPTDYDQRGPGFPRVVNDRIDVGAFEAQTVTPNYAGQVQPPINADGTSVFNSRRGVVPVKFTLAQGGVTTCDLPPATVAVTRTAGGVSGPVNESVYGDNADTGSNFRIDNCEYIYNLNSRALGAGIYRVDILIDDQVVGSATFELR